MPNSVRNTMTSTMPTPRALSSRVSPRTSTESTRCWTKYEVEMPSSVISRAQTNASTSTPRVQPRAGPGTAATGRPADAGGSRARRACVGRDQQQVAGPASGRTRRATASRRRGPGRRRRPPFLRRRGAGRRSGPAPRRSARGRWPAAGTCGSASYGPLTALAEKPSRSAACTRPSRLVPTRSVPARSRICCRPTGMPWCRAIVARRRGAAVALVGLADIDGSTTHGSSSDGLHGWTSRKVTRLPMRAPEMQRAARTGTTGSGGGSMTREGVAPLASHATRSAGSSSVLALPHTTHVRRGASVG